MNLKGLEALRAFMELRSLNSVADRLNRTQPQVSRLLAALEDEVGFALFTRNKRRLVPTPAAHELFGHVEHALLSLDNARAAAQRIRTGQKQHVRILTAPHITNAFLSDAIAEMTRLTPGFTASIDSRSRIDIEVWLGRERFDLGISVLPLENNTIEVEPLAMVRGVVVMSENHPLASREVIHVRDLVGVPLVANAPRTVMRQRMEASFRSIGATPLIRLETPNGLIACELAARGLGVALADGFVASASYKPGMALRLFEPAIELAYVSILPRWQPRSPAVTRLATLMREAAQKNAAQILPHRSDSPG